MENLKTLGQMLQEVVNWDDFFSLHEFLLEGTEEDRKRIECKLTAMDTEQFYNYMDGFNFVNEDEIYMAVCEYYEYTNCRALSMGDCGDMQEVADDYMRERNLTFDEE